MLMRKVTRLGHRRHKELPVRRQGDYPSEATMVYDPVQWPGQTDEQWRQQEKATRRYIPKRKFFSNLGNHVMVSMAATTPFDISPLLMPPGDAPDKLPVQYRGGEKAARIRKMQKGIAIAALATVPFIINRVAGEFLWSDSHPEFTKIASSQNPDKHCIILEATGFGTRSANETARKTSDATSMYGDVYSLTYDNSNFNDRDQIKGTVDISKITDVAEKIIRENGYKCLSGIGHSYGGLVIAGVMGELAERLPELRQDYEFLDGTPTGIDTVFSNEQRKGLVLITGLTEPLLNWLNGPYTRGAIEFSQRLDSTFDCDDKTGCHINWQGLAWAIGEAKKRMNSEAASNELLGAQFRSIVVANIRTSLVKLTDADERNEPVVVYIRPADPTRDNTVRTELSEAELSNITRELGLQFIVVMLPPPAGHANPGDATAAYRDGYIKVFEEVTPRDMTYTYDSVNGSSYIPKTYQSLAMVITIENPTR